MTPPRRTVWPSGVIALALSLAAMALLAAPPAMASHHLMQVREVFTGSGAPAADDYVELQMYSSAENFVGGQQLRLYNANGTLNHTFTFPTDVSNGVNQATVLTGAPGAAGTPDFTDPALNMASTGGAACFVSTSFGPIDCVSWGAFSGSLPSPAGNPAAAPSASTALGRSIARGCATLLDIPDDSNASAQDFGAVTPNPRNNSLAPTETACPETQITAGPSGMTTDRTPTFRFRSLPAGAGFQCKLDSGAFKACTSPHTLARQSLGRHTFKVRARNGPSIDPTPARRSFKVVRG